MLCCSLPQAFLVDTINIAGSGSKTRASIKTSPPGDVLDASVLFDGLLTRSWPVLRLVPRRYPLVWRKGVLNGYSSTRVSLWDSRMFGRVLSRVLKRVLVQAGGGAQEDARRVHQPHGRDDHHGAQAQAQPRVFGEGGAAGGAGGGAG